MAIKTEQIDRINIFIRCIAIQASWNFKALIGMGFCFCVIPLARRLCNTPEERSEFLRRHLEFFNAHPYFASYCLGAVTKLEEESLSKEWPDKMPISVFKERMAGPLGALGDELFWSRIKPVTLTLAMCLGLTVGWIALPVFLVAYNVPHFYIRLKGWRLSYRLGFDIVSVLSMRRFQKSLQRISMAGLILAGALLGLSSWWSLKQDLSVFVAFWLSAALALVLVKFKLSVKFVILTAIGCGLLVGAFFLIFSI